METDKDETSKSSAETEEKQDEVMTSTEKSELDWTNDENIYATQFFGYTPKALSDGLFNGYLDYVKEALMMTEQKMAQEFSKYMSVTDAENATHQLMNDMLPIVAKAFDRLEVYISSHTFCIPPQAVLAEDKVQLSSTYTMNDKNKLVNEIHELETAVTNAKYVNSALRQSMREANLYVAAIKQTLERAKTITDATKRVGLMGGVSDTVEFIRSQISQCTTSLNNMP